MKKDYDITVDLEISLHKRVPIIKASALSSSNTDKSIFSLSQYEYMIAHCSNLNVITLYLVENGLEITTKIFPQIFRILFITFIDNDTKLFIVAQDYACNEDNEDDKENVDKAKLIGG
ncbi:2661_t:CDS:1 [Entrophospora sp. SA101]|nr:2661_t:CDS:1 [Entrophospora sp. SA101]